jgi:hypothetical protein
MRPSRGWESEQLAVDIDPETVLMRSIVTVFDRTVDLTANAEKLSGSSSGMASSYKLMTSIGHNGLDWVRILMHQ